MKRLGIVHAAAITGILWLTFSIGLGTGYYLWKEKPVIIYTPVLSERQILEEFYQPRLELRIPASIPEEVPEPDEEIIEERFAVQIWEGGTPMPLPHLIRSIENTALHMGYEPRGIIKPLLEICAVESDFGRIVRQKSGSALSPWQIESRTWDELLSNLKKTMPEAYEAINQLYDHGQSREWNRTRNIAYACATAMMFIETRYPDGFEGLQSLDERARMWKRWYNTPKGKGTPKRYVEKAKEHIWGNYH